MGFDKIKCSDVISIFFVFSLFLISVFFNDSLSYRDICFKDSNSDIFNVSVNSINFECLYEFIPKNNLPSVFNFCKNLSIDPVSCLNSLTVANSDFRFCFLFNESFKSYFKFSERDLNLSLLRDNCFISLASSSNNSSFCSFIRDNRENTKCFFLFAIKFKNVSFCNSALNKSLCIYSYAIKSGNISICNFLSEKYKNDCRYNILDENN